MSEHICCFCRSDDQKSRAGIALPRSASPDNCCQWDRLEPVGGTLARFSWESDLRRPLSRPKMAWRVLRTLAVLGSARTASPCAG